MVLLSENGVLKLLRSVDRLLWVKSYSLCNITLITLSALARTLSDFYSYNSSFWQFVIRFYCDSSVHVEILDTSIRCLRKPFLMGNFWLLYVFVKSVYMQSQLLFAYQSIWRIGQCIVPLVFFSIPSTLIECKNLSRKLLPPHFNRSTQMFLYMIILGISYYVAVNIYNTIMQELLVIFCSLYTRSSLFSSLFRCSLDFSRSFFWISFNVAYVIFFTMCLSRKILALFLLDLLIHVKSKSLVTHDINRLVHRQKQETFSRGIWFYGRPNQSGIPS